MVRGPIVHNGEVDNVKYCAVEKWKILKNKLCFNCASMFHHDPEGGPGSTCDMVTCAHGGRCFLPRVFPRVATCECDLTTFTGPTCDLGE